MTELSAPLRDWEPDKHTFDRAEHLTEGFRNETDRGLALVAAARLDDDLVEVLRRIFSEPKAGEALLSEGNAPLQSFSAKINLCCALGLISKRQARVLHRIRDIRNRFAHAPEPLTFEDKKIRGWLSCCYGGFTPKHNTGDGFVLADPTPRDRFLDAVRSCALLLWNLATSVKAREWWPSTFEFFLVDEAERTELETWVIRVQQGEERPPRSWEHPRDENFVPRSQREPRAAEDSPAGRDSPTP